MKKGFTLIELLVVVAILGVLVTIGTSVFVGILRGSTKATTLTRLREDGDRVKETMTRVFESATEVVDPVDSSNICNKSYVIVKNRTDIPSPSATTGTSGVKQYTRFSFIPPTASANGYVSMYSDDNLGDMYQAGETAPFTLPPSPSPVPLSLNGTSLVNNTGSSAVNVGTGCFSVQKRSGVTVVSTQFVVSQSVLVEVGRNENVGQIDYQTAFTLRAY